MSETAVEHAPPAEILDVSTQPAAGHTSDIADPPSPPKDFTAAPLAAALAGASSVDAFLAHLQRCVRSRGGTDVVLLFVTYTVRLASAVLDGLSRSALRASARRLVALAFQLPPSSTLVLAGTPNPPPLAALALALSARMQAFVGMMGEWRTMNRLWGLLGMYFSAKDLLARTRAERAAGKAGDRFGSTVEAAQIAALSTYHVLEGAAWLSSKKVLGWSPKAQGRMGSWSVKAWAAYVGMDITKMLVERARRKNGEDEKADEEWRRKWNTEFLRTLSWAPLTVHWSVPGGILPEIAVASLAAYPSIGYMRDLWKSTAESS